MTTTLSSIERRLPIKHKQCIVLTAATAEDARKFVIGVLEKVGFTVVKYGSGVQKMKGQEFFQIDIKYGTFRSWISCATKQDKSGITVDTEIYYGNFVADLIDPISTQISVLDDYSEDGTSNVVNVGSKSRTDIKFKAMVKATAEVHKLSALSVDVMDKLTKAVNLIING